jgi:hypothetical protein
MLLSTSVRCIQVRLKQDNCVLQDMAPVPANIENKYCYCRATMFNFGSSTVKGSTWTKPGL